MSGCSVNLVPTARLHARARARRQRAWLAVGAAGSLLWVAGWAVQRRAAAARAQAAEGLARVETQRAEVQRRLVAADAQRTQLLGQLETLAGVRRPQPWPRRLVALTRAAPPGVFLTAVHVTTPAAEATASQRDTRASPAASGAGAQTRPAPSANAGQTVRLLGLAQEHAALLQLIQVLQQLPGWQRVDLVRATLEPYGGSLAVAFELDCRTQEDAP